MPPSGTANFRNDEGGLPRYPLPARGGRKVQVGGLPYICDKSHRLPFRRRRAVKFAEVHNPDSLKAFRNLVGEYNYRVVLADFLTIFAGGNANLAEQLWKQLENEGTCSQLIIHRRFRIHSTGFIEEVVTETVALGLVETRSRQTRSNKNKKKAQSTRTSKYAFVQAIKKSPIYQQYFSPDDMEVEQDLLQIPDVVRFALVRRNAKVANFTLVHCIAGEEDQSRDAQGRQERET